MRTAIAPVAFAAVVAALPQPQAVTSAISPSTTAGAGCESTYPGTFEIQLVEPASRKRSDNVLVITLTNGILKDQNGRTGYIASNYQFQFDGPPQAGAIYTAGWALCANNILSLGSQTTFYECLSGDFYNVYSQSTGAQCSPIEIQAINPSSGTSPVSQQSDGQPTGQPVSQYTDGQPQASTGSPVQQTSDGQPQAPTGSPVQQTSDGQPQAPTGSPVQQTSDGQPQAPTGSPVQQTSDGQPQAPTGSPVQQTSDGQPQAPTGSPVQQTSDGQPQAPTGSPVQQTSDGQPQAPTGTPVQQTSDGQPQATGSPVLQTSDGQPQATTGTPVQQTSDGQPQATGTPAPYNAAPTVAFGGAAALGAFIAAVAVL